jgi:WD40 repeat protein
VRDAATGDVLCTTKASHKGSVYSIAFSPDGSRIATSSADKTVKVWDLAADGSALTVASTIVVGKAMPDMQNGMVWAGDASIISASLCGNLSVSAPTDAAPTRTMEGPGGTVTMMRSDGGVFLTGDRSGAACLWTRKDGAAGFEAARATGDGHSKVVSCGDIRSGRFVTGGFDDKLRFGDVASGAYSAVATVGAQPKSVVLVPTKPNVAVVATSKFTKSFDTDSGAELSCIDAKWEGKAVAASPDGSAVFVGGGDGHVRSYNVDAAGVLTEAAVTASPLKSAVASLAVSPDGAHVAVGDAAKELVVLQAASLGFAIKDKWTAHTSRIASLAWNSSGSALASTGVDRHVFIWALSESFPVKRHNLAVSTPAHSICWEEGDAAVWVSSSNGVTKRIEITL